MKKYLLAEDTINTQDIQELISWLQTNPWLTQGPLVQEFQNRFSSWLGVKHSVFVNSGSSANLLMFYSLLMSGRLKNKKVIVPAVSWATTVAPAIQFGFEPIMCDADPENFGLNMKELEQLCIQHNPGAVIAVHVLGVPCRLDRLMQLKNRYGFYFMEDACAATGSSYKNVKVGNFGDLSSFSFFFGHHISTIEGGMVCTNDTELYEILLALRSHGWAKDLPEEKRSQKAKDAGVLSFNTPFTFFYPGFNVRSSDLNAKIGLGQMNKLDQVIWRRVENHRRYQQLFSEQPALRFAVNSDSEISSIAFSLIAESTALRDKIASELKNAGVETRPLGGGNMSEQPFWKKFFDSRSFPIADQMRDGCFQLPNHPGLTADDISFISQIVLNSIKQPS